MYRTSCAALISGLSRRHPSAGRLMCPESLHVQVSFGRLSISESPSGLLMRYTSAAGAHGVLGASVPSKYHPAG